MLDLIKVMVEASIISWTWYIGMWERFFDSVFDLAIKIVGLL